MTPSSRPDGSKTCRPSADVMYRLPFVSTAAPSAPPPCLPCGCFRVQNALPLPILPGASTGYAIIAAWPVGKTYSALPSGDSRTRWGWAGRRAGASPSPRPRRSRRRVCPRQRLGGAERGVGEVHAALPVQRQVVRRVEALAAVALRQHAPALAVRAEG